MGFPYNVVHRAGFVYDGKFGEVEKDSKSQTKVPFGHAELTGVMVSNTDIAALLEVCVFNYCF